MTEFYKALKNAQLPKVHKSHGKEYYVDPFRERLILKTPEETVRQKVLQYREEYLPSKVPHHCE